MSIIIGPKPSRSEMVTPGGGPETDALVVSGEARLLEIFGTNTEAGDVFIMVFDAVALPGNGTQPRLSPIPVPAGESFSLTMPEPEFGTGIYWAVSSTADTLTISVLAGANITVWHR